MKVQKYFILMHIILSLFVICFSCLCWAVSFSQAKTASCENNLSHLMTSAQSVIVVRGDLRNAETEFSLKARGYRSAFTDGLDKINRMIELAQKLRASKVDPLKTHIPEFADRVLDHIEFTRQGIADSNKEELKILDNLREEALEKLKSKSITYEWWLEWNFKLANRLNNDTDFQVIPPLEYSSDLLRKFPDSIFLPMTNVENLGIIAFNRSFSRKVFPIALNNKLQPADGVDFNPSSFFAHDVVHATASTDMIFNIIRRNLYKKVEKMNLSLSEREMVETIYFLILHEQESITEVSPSKFIQFMRGARDRLLEPSYRYSMAHILQQNYMRRLLPNSVDVSNLEEIQEYLDESVKVFKRINRQSMLR